MKREKGNIGELLSTGVCVLAMLMVMLSYFDIAELLAQKEDVGQIARKYILRMETVGGLTSADKALLTVELEGVGVTDVDYAGTTLGQVDYGEPIVLQIQGKLRGEYDFTEKRVSTAKN